jgi:hypothetical protein
LGPNSDFAKQVRTDHTWAQGTPFDLVHTMADARRSARIELSRGGWTLGTALTTPKGRRLTGPAALPTFEHDVGTVVMNYETLGGMDPGSDETLLGSYGLEMVPIGMVGPRKVPVRVTVPTRPRSPPAPASRASRAAPTSSGT